ncbi:coiled-coil domain-containing protein 138 [Takifugu rubripes]|uniref:Coiled-coil domain containing 138 n=1 Tax=Takifugu rubripes TaxID=31033 RepID=H2SCV2_TAKRU|nr:coiled-coil domain-containing protein 138 [Takifugu rubripes]
MEKPFEGTSETDAVAKLQRKYLDRRTQLPPSEEILPGASDEAPPQLTLCTRYHHPNKALTYYTKALRELCKVVTSYPKEFASELSDSSDSSQDLQEGCNVAVFQDSQGVFTEADVTLPSCLDGSPGSPETQREGRFPRACQRPVSCHSPSSVFANVFQEMMAIHTQLKAEHQRQHHFERELQERERRLNQQGEAFVRMDGLQETLETRISALEKKHQQEVSELQERLREQSKENRRLKSNFDTIRELNDNMKKQLNEVREQNKKLVNQSKRVFARLENLQRKCEHSVVPRDCFKSTELIKPVKKDRTVAAMKPTDKSCSSLAMLKLLAFLMDWILDSQMFTSRAGNERKGVDQRWPPVAAFGERCVKVLPLLADQLHHTCVSQPELFLNLLRLIDGALRHIDHKAQHAAASVAVRQIGKELSKLLTPITAPATEEPQLKTGGSCHWPPFLSPCPQTRVLSSLIVLRTVAQADVLALALDSLHAALMSEECRGLFLRHDGVDVLMLMLRTGRGGWRTPLDILMRLAEHSCYLQAFLDACSCEDFFQTASRFLKNPHLDLPSLEKLSILLQKLSNIRKNRRLFELSSLRRQIQELQDRSSPEDSFLCLNLRSILLNLQ